jgi:hypothetical protein
MEIISGLNQKTRYCYDIELHPYLQDHRVQGKAVLPAVESLIVMAGVVKTHYPTMMMDCLKNATFSRFLTILPDKKIQHVFVDVEDCGDGGITTSLLTSLKSKTGNINRDIEHARVSFYSADSEEFRSPPFHIVNKLEGQCISVPSTTVYRDLIPFGVSFQNIVGDVSVSREGAVAYMFSRNNEADEDLLGSPFALDTVMHAACVWGQRFAGIVPFPVGFEKRIIHRKTKKGEEYLGRVVPLSVNKDSVIFDAWIYKNDVMYESISGMKLMDVTKGRMRPPDWIKADL